MHHDSPRGSLPANSRLSAWPATTVKTCLQVEASRLILIVISSCGEPDLHKLGLDEHEILRFPAYTAKEMRNVFKRRMRKLEGVQVFDPEALQYLFDQASCHTSERAMLCCCCLQNDCHI